MKIDLTPIDKLIPYVRNPRKNQAAIAKVAASINEFGFRQPIVTDSEMVVVAGHTRLEAARMLGLTQVPIHVAEGLTRAQLRAYRLADNRTGEDAEWDNELLAIELGDFDDDMDLSLTGFDDSELSALLALSIPDGLTDEDAVPDIPGKPVTVFGDVWVLGRHRLMCGDSTDIDSVEKVSQGSFLDLCFTSPPYLQRRDYKSEIIDWDNMMNGVFKNMPMKQGAQVLVNLGLVHQNKEVNQYWSVWINYMTTIGWPLFGWYVWDQGSGMPGNWNGRLAPSHEFIFHFSSVSGQSNKWVDKKPGSIGNRSTKGQSFRQKDGSLKAIYSPDTCAQPTKIADSVIRVNRSPSESAKTGHPAIFPVALCEFICKSFAKAGDNIYEPFCGSGTAIIAAEKVDMNCYCMELAPEYCDVIINRWQDFTGKQAQHEQSGKSFNDLSESRFPRNAA